MQMAEEWLKTWICLSFLLAWVRAARPRFDVSTDMGLVLVPADAEVDTAIFRLRATDQDTDFPLVFEIIATTSPIVRVENLPCTLYNKVCQANVILTRRLVAGRLHDFVVRVRDSKGDVNSMQATISVTNSTTPRDKIFPHLPSLIMVPEDTKPEKELDYLLVESNPWSGKPVYIELWQPKELFKIRQRQIGSQTKGIITLIGELDFETQSMYTLTMYATDPYTERGKDTRNIAGLHVVVIVQDVQDVPPVFTLAPPLTKISNSIKPGDLILRVHAEDGDKGVPRDVTYGLISEGNPFTSFFNVSETTGEISLAKPLEELTKIIHVGAPIVLKIVAEEIRSTRDEPPAQATVVELGLLLGEPGNSPPYFENDNYVAWIDENAEPGTIIIFTEDYSTKVKDEDIGKAGVFALKLENNNGTFEVSPAVAERSANFVITVRDNTLVDYEKFRSLRFKIVAQEVGPATNLSTSVPVTIFLRDINDNLPIFDNPVYDVTLAENANVGLKVVQVHATDNDAGVFGKIQYTKIIGDGSEAFDINPDNGLVTVSMGSVLDREQTQRLELTVEARDEDGRGLRGTATLIVNILDVNDNSPIFEKGIYEFLMNAELTDFSVPAFVKAFDADAEPPNNIVQYEIVHGNYENKFQLNEETGEIIVREPINRSRKVRQHYNRNLTLNMRKQFRRNIDEGIFEVQTNATEIRNSTSELGYNEFHSLTNLTREDSKLQNQNRSRRAEDNPLFILTVRAYDLGVPTLSNTTQIRIMRPIDGFARIVMFVMPGENPDPKKTAETLATITGSRVIIQEIKPYVSQINTGSNSDIGKRSVVVARVEQNGPGTLVDVDKIRASLTANGFGIISGMDNVSDNIVSSATDDNASTSNTGRSSSKNISVINSTTEDVIVYKAENKLLTWLLALLGLLLLAAIITLIICCICPSCPFYMEPRKRRIHSSETLVIHSDGRPKRHLHRKPMEIQDKYYSIRKEAWSADQGRQNWKFNRRNTKNLGIASLPGDIGPGHENPEIERLRRVASLRLRDDDIGDAAIFSDQVLVRTRMTNLVPQNERIYVEDVETQNRNYEPTELESLRKHELERGSDGISGNDPMLPGQERLREQHFYRDGNTEVLRLITRGEIEDYKNFREGTKELHHANAKDILLQRFIEDQKFRRSQNLRDSFHESFHDADADRSMESHLRANEITEILILPEKLEPQRQPSNNQRQHQQEQTLNAEVPRLIVERNYKSKDFKGDEGDEYRNRGILKASMQDAEMAAGEVAKGAESVSYVMQDVELVRQNALLTRLLLEKETRGLNVPMVDSSSFLETQSLPGHAAIATQTDRTTATQTEFFGRSRSDNEEVDEDQRIRRKSKLKDRFETKEDFKTLKTIWVRAPIPEESRTHSGNKISTPTRTKIEVIESCKVSISPDVLKEISSSLKSSESGCFEEDEDEEVLVKRGKVKPAIMQKAHKLTSKAVSMSKKKVKEAKADNDSTTASPEVKEKKTLMKNKIRKKAEKPVQAKKLEKSVELERSYFMEPSFRVLEREINNFQQKIREFGDKKLKIIKRDNRKMDKDFKFDSGTSYDVSKKCEFTVKKTRKSTSRETSPIKISVEQKAKTSEEESRTQDQKLANQEKAKNSTSEFEDSDKLSRQSLNLNEKLMVHSDIQTSSRSKLLRQENLRNSEPKSESEKIEKSEDSESKTYKLKDSTSSLEMKIDSTSSSSRDFVTQQKQKENKKIQKLEMQEKKCKRSQKLTTKLRPTGMVDIKRKVLSLEPKSIEESRKRMTKTDEKSDINKTSTSDDSKSISPSKSKENAYNKKSTASEEKKSDQETKSAMTKKSTAIDLDKLVEEVKDAVGKEISTFTQAAKDALGVKKTNPGTTDNMEKKLKSPLKLKGIEKIESTVDKKRQEIDIFQTNNDKISKSSEKTDDKEKIKYLEEKSQDKISFIIIEKNKETSNAFENLNKFINQKSDTVLQDLRSSEGLENHHLNQIENKNDAKTVSTKSKEFNEKDSEIKLNISENIVNIEKLINDKLHETNKNISAKIDESNKTILDGNTEKTNTVPAEFQIIKQSTSYNINETKKTVFNKVDDTKNMTNTVTGKTDETIKIIPDTVGKIVKDVSNKIDKTTKIVPLKSNEIKKNITEKVHETEKTLSDKIDNFEKMVNDTGKIIDNNVDETNTIVKNKIGDKEKMITDNVNKAKKISSDKIHDIEKVINDNINEAKKMISDKIDDTKKTAIDKIDETKKLVVNKSDEMKTNSTVKIDETTKNLPYTVDEIKQTVTDKTDKTKETISEEINKLEKNIPDKINKMEASAAHKIDEIKEIISDKINATKRTIFENISENKDVIIDKNYDSKIKVEKEITNSDTKRMLFKKQDQITTHSDMDSTSKENDITVKNRNDLLSDEVNKTKRKNMNIAKEIENKNLEQDLFKSKFACLPYEIKDPSEKQRYENNSEMNKNKEINDVKDSSEIDKNKTNIESLSTFKIKTIDDSAEMVEKDNGSISSGQKEELCKKKSISLLNGSFKEKEKETTGVTQMKLPIKDKMQESLNNEDYVSPSNLNEGKEISSLEVTQSEKTKESETEQKRKTETEKNELISLNVQDNIGEILEVHTESSQPKQLQGQGSAVEINSVIDANKEKFIPGIEENKGISDSVDIENKEASGSMKDFSRQLDDSKKAIFELTNAINSIKIDGEESDNDSSSATDISNKTALRTEPYSTPRHSISPDEIGDTSIIPKLGKTLSNVKSNGKARQKWSSDREEDPLLQVAVQQPKESSVTAFPQKAEMTPPDKPKTSTNKATLDQTKMQKSPTKETHVASALTKSIENTETKMSNSKQRSETPRTRPVTVAVKKKDRSRKTSPGREKDGKTEKKKSQRPNQSENCTKSSSEQRKVEIRSRHLKLHVSHRTSKAKNDSRVTEERGPRDFPGSSSPMRDSKQEGTPRMIDHAKEPEIANARSRYMAWYQQKRLEMERKRRERKESEEEQLRLRWLKPRTSGNSRKAKSAEDVDQRHDATKKLPKGRRSKERAKSSSDAGHSLSSNLGRSNLSRLRIRPLINVESEQLKAIVRQGRRLRKAEGMKEDPEVQIFVPEKPLQFQVDELSSTIQLEPRHHLTQHSEYKYEKQVPPLPFYLHPPLAPHPAPEHIQDDSSENRRLDEDLDSGIALSMQGGTRLRHQELLEKKSVFDIAYSEAAPTQLRSDSSTPPT